MKVVGIAGIAAMMRDEIDGHRDDTSKFRHLVRSTNYMRRRGALLLRLSFPYT